MNNILNLLNDRRISIMFNGILIDGVTYNEDVDIFSFWISDGIRPFLIHRDNIGLADWDEEDGSNDPFYIFIDTNNIHHIVRFYRNDSLNIMRDIKGVL